MTRALALTSGGLDSILAAKLIEEQGIEVIAICFKSAFFGSANAEKMAAQTGLNLKVIDFTDEHIELTKGPKHGYGKNMNPCIDCHAMMLRYAGRLMEELEADFLVTGEVLDQRPMSQNKKSLDIVLKESGYRDKVLRPLCAQNLPPTQMELDGLVDRERLLGISGKSRKPQMELAARMGITEYPSPAGGCMLTEPQFADRLRDLYNENKAGASGNDIELLKIGRHFRLSPDMKAISTRNGEEYKRLWELLRDRHIIMNAAEYSGSTMVLTSINGCTPSEEELATAAAINARYCKGKDNEEVRIRYRRLEDTEYSFITVKPMADEEIKKYII